MSKILKGFILLKLCVLQDVYQTVAVSTPTDAKPNNMKSDNEVLDARLNSTIFNSNKTIGAPTSLLIHHLQKRSIDPNQGSNWLKYVWKERQFKIPQMFLTNVRNMWAVDPAGGRHAFDAGVPYGAVYMLKTLLLDVLFPPIGQNQ